MSESTTQSSTEIAKKIKTLAAKGLTSSEVLELVQHVHLGSERIIKNPVVVHHDGKDKSIEIFEHYRVERDEHDGIKLLIKCGKTNDASSSFEPYSYGFADTADQEHISSIGARWGSYKWIFDIPIDSTTELYNSFVEKNGRNIARLSYLELACIIKMAEYFNILHHVDHDFLMFMTKNNFGIQIVGKVEDRELKWTFRELYKIVYKYMDEQYYEHRFDYYLSYLIHAEIKKQLKSMCSKRSNFLYDTLTQRGGLHSGNVKVKKTMRISRIAYLSERFAPYMNRVKKLEKYSKAQLFYLLMFQHDIEQLNNLNYFSYDNMVLKEGEEAPFKFPNKKALRNFNEMDVEVLDKLFMGVKKVGILEKWFVSHTNEYNGYCSNSDHDNDFNGVVWEVLMVWLSYGECHVGLKNNKQNKDKIGMILRIIGTLKCAVACRSSVVEDLKINPEKMALTLDFCCKYLDHIGEDLQKHREDFELKTKKIKDKYKEEFGVQAINYAVKRLDEETRIPIVRLYEQRSENFSDFISHWDGHWGRFPNLESIERTTTFKSIERKIERWHDELQAYTPEELEKAKTVKYSNLNQEPIEYKDCVFTPICTQYELMIEGAEMRHCVASFNGGISSGGYIVFKAVRGEERATLGVRVRKDATPCFAFSQCYKKHNHLVSHDMNIRAQEFIVYLNKHPKLILVSGALKTSE